MDDGIHVIHALLTKGARAGLPVCGFSTKPPEEWPTDEIHAWVPLNQAAKVTCALCKEHLEGLLKPEMQAGLFGN